MTAGLVLTAFALGLRHGIDWDHIAAIADLSSTAGSRRRGFVLSFVYALGHAIVVIVLGAAAIIFGASLPPGVDIWMGRIVGATLVVLGAWVLIELVRKGRDFRLRSRWILVLGGTFTGLRRVRNATARRRLQIEHDHDHVHDDDGVPESQAHDHAHLDDISISDPVGVPDSVGVSDSLSVPDALGVPHRGRRNRSHSPLRNRTQSHSHSHSHSHRTALAEDVAATGNGTAAGIGLLHGVGFESPTQIAVFVASTSLVGVWAGFSLLVAWVVGLVIANSVLAGLAAFGLLGAERNFTIYATVATFVAVASLAMGGLMLFGLDSVIPAI